MIINLYKTDSAAEAVVKNLAEEQSFSGDFILPGEETKVSVKNPVVRLIVSNADDIFRYNYAWIEHLGRYYYIDDIKIYRQTRGKTFVELSLSVDVLMSFWDEFGGNNAVVSRSEDRWNDYLNDPQLPVQQDTLIDRRVVDTDNLGNPLFNGYSLIMVGAGIYGAYYDPDDDDEEEEPEVVAEQTAVETEEEI